MIVASLSERMSGDVATTILPRVLYVTGHNPSVKFGSGEEQSALLGRGFEQAGGLFLPVFSAPDADSLAMFQARGVRAACIDFDRFTLDRLRKLIRLVDENEIDIVHWSYFHPTRNPWMWALTIARPRLRHWYTDHVSRFFETTAPPLPVRLLKRLLLRRYDGVICVSDFVAGQLAKQQTWRRVTTHLHFINTDRFRPDPDTRLQMRARHGVEHKTVLLCVGYLIHDKGCDLAIEAMPHLPDDCELWIVGYGPVVPDLEAQAKRLGVADRVRFFGAQAQAEPYFQAADIFITPSRWAEAAGFVNIEAQACGLPVVASRTGGIPEYVADGDTGLLFERDNAADLLSKLKVLISDNDLRTRFGLRARTQAESRFSHGVGLRSMLELYRNGVRDNGRLFR